VGDSGRPPTCALPREKAPFGPLGDGGCPPWETLRPVGAGRGARIANVHAPRSTAPAGAGAQGLGYNGCPPPPLGLPGPTRPNGQHDPGAGAGLSCGPFPGSPGPGWQFGHGGGGSDGAALTSPTPNVGADMPTPIAIAAAPARRFTYIFLFVPSETSMSTTSATSHPGGLGAKTTAATPHSDATVCLCKSSQLPTVWVNRTCRAGHGVAKCADAQAA
jgi:hypothetical protein